MVLQASAEMASLLVRDVILRTYARRLSSIYSGFA
jgi:hypothetical protein|tara:strand:+ start:157 stop:261 length:105 start_codon:yes stop_codon:yes gene_type:complete